MNYTATFKNVLLVILTGLLLLLFGSYCPIEKIIGIPCPGCNMFTAFYYLFKLDFKTALYFHPLAIFTFIYFILVIIIYFKKHTLDHKYIKLLTTLIVCGLIIVYIYRMIYVFPSYPMQYNYDSLIYKLLRFIS